MPVFVGTGDTSSRIRSNRVGFASHSANPGTASEGDVYFNSSDGGLRAYDGSAWSAVGAGGGTFSGIASGTLSNGQTVIIQSDGTVAGVTTSQVTAGIAGTETFNAEATYNMSLGYDPVNDKFLIIWVDESSNNTKAVVGTVNTDSNTISFGSEVTFLSGKTDKSIAILYDDTNNVFITIYSSPGAPAYLKGKTATISGDSVTFGTEASSGVTYPDEIVAAFDTKNAVFAVSTRRGADNFYGKLHLGQVSNGQLTWSSNTGTFTSYMTEGVEIGYDKTAEKFLVAYKNQVSSTGQSRVATITPGTNPSVSFGSETQLTSVSVSAIEIEYSPTAEKLLVAYRRSPNNYTFARVAVITGTSVSYGTEAQISTSNNNNPKLVYNTTTTNIDIFEDDSSISFVRPLSISGTSVTVSANTVSAHDRVVYVRFVYASNSDRGVIIGYWTNEDPAYGKAAVYTPSFVSNNLTSTNFLGFSDAAYSDGATVKVQIVGSVDDAQTGLTTGSIHYVQTDGTLSTTAGTPSVIAGIALTDTKILIRK